MSGGQSLSAGRGGRLALLAIALMALLMAGCFKADVDLTVAPDGRMSGTMFFGYSLHEVAEWNGARAHARAAALLADLDGADIPGMRCVSADDDEYAGVACTLHDVPYQRLGELTVEGSRIWFSANRNRLTVHGAIDTTQQMTPDGVGYDVQLRITFPGRIVGESTGEVSGRTVSWAPPQGDLTRIQATGTAAELPATNVAAPRSVTPLTALGSFLVILAWLLAAVRQRRLG